METEEATTNTTEVMAMATTEEGTTKVAEEDTSKEGASMVVAEEATVGTDQASTRNLLHLFLLSR